jgi:hypothetical protein
MSLRVKRRKKTGKIFLKDGTFLKVRLIPWLRTKNGCVWLVSMAVSKSNRQVNDWLKRRGNTRVRRLDISLTGKSGNLPQALAVRFMRWCQTYIPVGDSLAMRCESAVPDRQFRVWRRWFERHEDSRWQIIEEERAFFFYKSH